MKTLFSAKTCFVALLFSILLLTPFAQAQAGEKMLVTALTASNQGTDFNLDNDQYRDKLIQLFSYSSYDQVNQWRIQLQKAEHQTIALIEGYELVLTLEGEESDRIIVQALVRKDGVQYVNTVLSILKKGGVVFVGGPVTEKGALIVVLEKA